MEEDLLARLRADSGVRAATGRVDTGSGERPTVDWIERRSDATAAFPALVLQVISRIGKYDQDGPCGLQIWRVRLRCFGTDYLQTQLLLRAGRAVLEVAATVGSTRFHRAKLLIGRDLPPEDLDGQLKVYRTEGDFGLPFTPTGE